MKKYWEYFKYLIKHKKDVFVECWKMGLYLQAFTHDLSKFLPSEFIPHVRYIYSTSDCSKCGRYVICSFKDKIDISDCHLYETFKKENSVKLHYRRNKHHWEYWRFNIKGRLNMPDKYIIEMVCDWRAHCKNTNKLPMQMYLENYKDIKMTESNRLLLESILDINNIITCKYGKTIERFAKTSSEDIFWKNYSNLIGLFDFDLYEYLRNPFSTHDKKPVKIGIANVKDCGDGVEIQISVDDIV